METVLTLEIPDELARRARALAAAENRRLESAVVEWIAHAIAEPTVASLPDDELLRICDASRNPSDQDELWQLLARRRESGITDADETRLDDLMAAYRVGMFRTARAVREAAARGLRPQYNRAQGSSMAGGQPGPGDAFERWWADLGSSLPLESPEASARSAWDAAILAAAVLLRSEVDRLVHSKDYETAAMSNDCRRVVAGLFARWSMEQPCAEKMVERHKEFLRGLPDGRLEEVRRNPSRAGSPEAQALDCVLRERGWLGARP